MVHKLDNQEVENLKVILGIYAERTLRKGGISYENVRYDSEKLASYRKQMGRRESRKVKIKINPEDISEIYVFIDGTNNYISVPSANPSTAYTKGLSLELHKASARLSKTSVGDNVDEFSLAKARLFINDRIEEEVKEVSKALRKSKVSGTKLIARTKNIHSENLKSIAESLLPPEEEKQVEDETKGADWDDFISDLEAF